MKAYKKTKKRKGTRKKQEKKPQTHRHCRNFFRALRKHVAIGKGFMAAHAHDIRLKVRPKRSNISRSEQAKFLTFEPVGSKVM
jgi:hypothetical protein